MNKFIIIETDDIGQFEKEVNDWMGKGYELKDFLVTHSSKMVRDMEGLGKHGEPLDYPANCTTYYQTLVKK